MDVHFDVTSPKYEELEDVQIKAKEADVTWARKLLENKHTSLHTALYDSPTVLKTVTRNHQLGQLFGFTSALCHNDLLSGNVLLSAEPAGDDEGKTVSLIDYEYASYNFRAFDIANHFIENTGFDLDLINNYPSEAHRVSFLRHYLAALDRSRVGEVYRDLLENEDFIAGLEVIVRTFLLTSHSFWGAWAVVQAGAST
eukprot:gene38971-48124_t